MYKILLLLLLISAGQLHAQTGARPRIVDAATREPLAGATIQCAKPGCGATVFSNKSGEFDLQCNCNDSVNISFVGYRQIRFVLPFHQASIQLEPLGNALQEMVYTANRGEAIRRSEAPVAISSITPRMIKETKATRIDQLLNKVSGVNMVSLGNEQHQMSIRQPMTTRSLFLYLEDGIPVRTTGLFNHNALLEMNMAAVSSIEVIRGPSGSLYGSEAIGGVVNFITRPPGNEPLLRVSAQADNIGYKRSDLAASFRKGKWGFALGGYYADKRNGFLDYTDFHKAALTGRIDYQFSTRTMVSNSFTWMDYYSDMPGGIDSTMFAARSFSNLHSFTNREVDAFRYRSTLTHNWNADARSTFSIVYRNNSIGQNPAYRVKDDYRRQGGIYIGRKDLAHGEINESNFNSYALIGQHRQQFKWKNTAITGGFSLDVSPSAYQAAYIRIDRDSITKRYTSYTATDSLLSNYSTRITNYAAFLNLETSPIDKLRLVASLRFDGFRYDYDNQLQPSAFSGAPDAVNRFSRISPKLGFTYNFSNRTGIYGNYSEGFVPPQVTEMYNGVKVPSLNPAVFRNYEAGGWLALQQGKLTADLSVYRLEGKDAIISVRLDDGSFANRNAGSTVHRGVEAGLRWTPSGSISLRFSGAYSKHEFGEYVEKGNDYHGKEMHNAPNWVYNVEVWYRPEYLKGFRIGLEWQHLGSYFMDPANTEKYKGYDVLNLRTAYQAGPLECWVNLVNLTDTYYSTIGSKSNFGYSYQVGEPLHFSAGLAWDISSLLQKH